MGKRTYAFDAKMVLADGAAATVASGQGQVGGASKVIDMGGAPRRTDLGITGGMARADMGVQIDVSAGTFGATNLYRIMVIGSNNSNLSSGQVLASMILGGTAVLPNGAATSTIGRYELMLSTEQADINYEFIGLYIEVVGTSPSITLTALGVLLADI